MLCFIFVNFLLCPKVPKKPKVALYARQMINFCFKSTVLFVSNNFVEKVALCRKTLLLTTFASIKNFWFSARLEPTSYSYLSNLAIISHKKSHCLVGSFFEKRLKIEHALLTIPSRH